MASREEINAKRSQARQRHRAATHKISRLKSKGDVSISGTQYDPRVAPEKLKRYNSRQLDSYIAKLDAFVSRETQFVPGAKGRPMPVAGKYGWGRVAKLQHQLNKDKAAHLAKIANIFLPSAGMTIGERVEMSTPKHPVTSPPASYAPHIPYTRTSKGVPNEKQLKKLAKELESKQGGKYFEQKYKSQMTAARKMIKGISNKALAKDFRSLNPEEFSLLWNYTNFAEVTSTDYVIRKSMMHDKKELAWYDISLDTQLREARKRIAEIKALKLGGRL